MLVGVEVVFGMFVLVLLGVLVVLLFGVFDGVVDGVIDMLLVVFELELVVLLLFFFW